MQACPFQVPTYEWGARFPRVRKCSMCADRQAKGLSTACVEACPTGATACGDRTELIAEAKGRITGKPGEYYPAIFGLREVGGTSVLYLSAVPFDKIGLRTNVPQEPLPALTWRALSAVPDVASVGATLLGGVYWITHRREKVAAEEGRK
jgi:formate dehydrogenase iron-sulfur subunit